MFCIVAPAIGTIPLCRYSARLWAWHEVPLWHELDSPCFAAVRCGGRVWVLTAGWDGRIGWSGAVRLAAAVRYVVLIVVACATVDIVYRMGLQSASFRTGAVRRSNA
jgi:hypothetical protein